MTAGVPTERTTIADDAADLIAHPLRREQVIGRSTVCGELEEVVRVCADEFQRIEVVTHDLITERLLSTAVGVQLDQWGRRLGCERYGMGDDDYRALLYVWIAVLRSDGQAQLLQKIVRLLMGASATIYRHAGMAHFMITYALDTPSTDQRRTLLERVLELAAIVGVSWTVTEGDTAGFFGFSGNPDPDCKGFGEGALSALAAQVNR